jgi:acyl-CoA synthetase (AMP-forming)/AMP-acid ligase II
MLRLLSGEAARRFGVRTAFDTGSARLSFSDLDRLSDEVAAGYAHRGVRMGDIVALVLPDGLDFPVCYLAAAKIGAIAAGVPPDHPGLAAELRRLGAALVVARAQPPPAWAPLAGGDSEIVLVGDGQPAAALRVLRRAEPPPPPLPPDPQRPVAIVYTAGRTGRPKGVVFADRQLSAIRAQGAGVRWGTGDARLLSRPLTHMGFMTRLPVLLQTGRTSHILPRWDAVAVSRLIRDHGLAILQGTPGQLAEILQEAGGPVETLRLILSADGPAKPGLVRSLRERFGVPVCNRYLCTEAGLGLGTGPADPPQDAELTVGRPRPGIDLDIRDLGGHALPDGEVGEVLLRSQAVMSGYFHDPWGNARAFAKDGFVRTGDLGYVDREGRLHVIGRTTDRDSSPATG